MKQVFRRKWKLIISAFLLLLLVIISIFRIFIGQGLSTKEQKQYAKILDGTSVEPLNITINFADNPVSTGSFLIFGGSHAPDPSQEDAWEKIASAGVTSIRKDFFIDRALPTNITLEDYKHNKDNIQNVANWNMEEINAVAKMYKKAKVMGMKVFGIVTYAPSWLTYSHTIYGVPKDWDIYEDLVKKTYRIYRDNLDYVEIWNEPNFDYFLNLANSNMSREEAYERIYYHAAKAIREVDAEINDGKQVSLGGPVSYNPTDTSILETILASDRTKKYVDFISYHNYDKEHLKEPSWGPYKSALAKYHREDLPIFITEWNYDPNSQGISPLNTSNLAIPYTGNKFVDFLKMGLAGASYHVLEPLDLSLPNGGEGHMGFYRWKNGKAELLPQAKTWRLMSKDMGLGNGDSTVILPEENNLQKDNQINIIGFTNVKKQQGVVLVNNSASSSAVNLHLNNINQEKYVKLQVYNASSDNNAQTHVYSRVLEVENNSFKFPVYLPDHAVVGVVFESEKRWPFLDKWFR